LQQVVDGRSQSARPCQCGKIPVADDASAGRMSWRKPAFHGLAQHDTGVVHSQRPENPLREQIFVALSGSERERVTEKADSEIGILIPGADVSGKLVTGQKSVQLVNGVVRVRVVLILGTQVIRKSRKS